MCIKPQFKKIYFMPCGTHKTDSLLTSDIALKQDKILTSEITLKQGTAQARSQSSKLEGSQGTQDHFWFHQRYAMCEVQLLHLWRI